MTDAHQGPAAVKIADLNAKKAEVDTKIQTIENDDARLLQRIATFDNGVQTATKQQLNKGHLDRAGMIFAGQQPARA